MHLRMMAERIAATNKYPGADWGKLLRDAIPGIFERNKDVLALIEKINGPMSPKDVDEVCAGTVCGEKKWQEVDIPIKVDGVARENKIGPCKGRHYVLGHQVEIEKFRLTWTTWTLENQTIKFNSCYDFEIHGEELVLNGGQMNLFACGIIKDPHGNGAYELLTELGETKKLFN